MKVRQEINKILSPGQLTQALLDPGSCDYIISTRPLPTNRGSFVTDIASRRIFEMLWEEHLSSS